MTASEPRPPSPFAAPRRFEVRLFRPAPPQIEVELIRLLFQDAGSIWLLSTVVAAVMTVAAIYGDLFATVLAGVVLAITLARLVTMRAFAKAGDAATENLASARRQERRFAWQSNATAAGIAAANVHGLGLGDAVIDLLIVGVTFGYVFGLVNRMAVRPRIGLTGIVIAFVPTALAFGGAARDSRLLTPALATAALSIIALVLLGSALQTLSHSYRLILDQLLARRDLSRMARRDALTELPNRIGLRERFDREAGGPLAVHYLDLDRFKAVNDQYGHRIGDALLRQVANRMTVCLAAGDVVARLGGDEFALIQAGAVTAEAAEALARRVSASVSEPYTVGELTLTIGVSIGIARCPDHGDDLDQLLALADAALYAAKQSGRGGVAVYRHSPAVTRLARA